MKWSLSLSTILAAIVILPSAGSALVNYVTPSREVHPCLTFEVYTSEPANVHFINNSVFYFLPGSHRINASLRLVNVQNFN